MACRMLGECRFGLPIDREIGDMIAAPGAVTVNWTGPKLFTYVRYDPDVTQAGLNNLGLSEVKAENVQVMDSVKFIPDIQRVGKAFAEKHVTLEHIGKFV